jgi:hypothetical protein
VKKNGGRWKQKIITCILLMPLVLSIRIHAAINAKDEHGSKEVGSLYYKFRKI